MKIVQFKKEVVNRWKQFKVQPFNPDYGKPVELEEIN